MEIIQEVKYDETMKTTVEPYLKQRCISGYTDSYDAVGKLHVLRYQADMPKGVIVICHGFTESYPKYDLLLFTGRLSCVAAGTLRTWMELSPDERFFSGTY